jgi:enoyl-CoA hydratase
MADEIVRYRFDDGVALIAFDDGKVNAFSHAALQQLHGALDRAEADQVRAVALVGRPGCFSAGFDLKVMRSGVDAARDLARAGGQLALRVFSFEAPVVLGVTGHALAMAAVLCLAGDERIGADGDFKLGLNEVAIGLALPQFGIELARERLSPRHLTRAVCLAEIYSPAGAVEAGFLDRLATGSVMDETRATARRLAETLDPAAYRTTKLATRADCLDRLRRALSDVRPLTPG